MEGDFIRQRHSLKMSQDFNPRPPWGGRRDLSQRNKVAFLISIHALRGEGDDDKTTAAKLRDDFNPRPPWGGRHIFGASNRKNSEISIHALRGEGDRPPRAAREPRQKFQSTPSVGRATMVLYFFVFLFIDFNPRPPWGGRPNHLGIIISERIFQSTPSVGRATGRGVGTVDRYGQFQSTPSVGRATTTDRDKSRTILFQSTPSVGRATLLFCCIILRVAISIHALRGEGDNNVVRARSKIFISIHALRGEGDSPPCFPVGIAVLFQSTPSVGRATRLC